MYTNGLIVSISGSENTIIWTQKRFSKTTSYNIISMIILNNYHVFTYDNHNVILNVSDRSVEKLASPDKILESVNFIKNWENRYLYKQCLT